MSSASRCEGDASSSSVTKKLVYTQLLNKMQNKSTNKVKNKLTDNVLFAVSFLSQDSLSGDKSDI